jgi:hypothetical protein
MDLYSAPLLSVICKFRGSSTVHTLQCTLILSVCQSGLLYLLISGASYDSRSDACRVYKVDAIVVTLRKIARLHQLHLSESHCFVLNSLNLLN